MPEFGEGFVSILPDLAGFGELLVAQLEPALQAAGQSVSASFAAAIEAGAAEAGDAGVAAAARVDAAWANLAGVGAFGVEVSVASEEAATTGVAAADRVEAAWAAVGEGAAGRLAPAVAAASGKAAASASAAAEEVAVAWEAAGAGAGAGIAESVSAGSAKAAAAGVGAAEKVGGAWAATKGLVTGLFGGALALGGLDLLVKGAVDYGHAIQQLTSAYGIDAQEAARLRTETDLVGLSITSVIPTIARLTKAAADSSSSTAKALEKYGISVREFRNADIQGQLQILADAYDRAGGHAKQFLADVLGGRGTKLAPLLANYRDLSHVTAGISFPTPSEPDIIQMEKFQVQMRNLVLIVETKLVPAIVKAKTVIIAMLAVWSATKIVKFVGVAVGGIKDLLKWLGLLKTAEVAAAGAGAAEGVAGAAAGGGLVGFLGSVAGAATVAIAALVGVPVALSLFAKGNVEGIKKMRADLAALGVTSRKTQDEIGDSTREAGRFAGAKFEAIKRSIEQEGVYRRAIEATARAQALAHVEAQRSTQLGVSAASITAAHLLALQQELAARAGEHLARAQDNAAAAVGRAEGVFGTQLHTLQDLHTAYGDWRDATASSISGVFDSFDQLAGKQGVTFDKIEAGVRKSVAGLRDFGRDLHVISQDAKAGVPGAQELVQHLIELGPAGQHVASVIAAATPAARRALERDIGGGLTEAQTIAKGLEKTLTGGFQHIAAAILIALGKAKTFAEALQQLQNKHVDVFFTTHYQTVGSPPPSSPAGQHNQQTQGNAAGGRVRPGYSYVVGESGFELFRPGEPGQVIPHGRASALLERAAQGEGGAGGGLTINGPLLNIERFESHGTEADARALAPAIERELRRRNVVLGRTR